MGICCSGTNKAPFRPGEKALLLAEQEEREEEERLRKEREEAEKNDAEDVENKSMEDNKESARKLGVQQDGDGKERADSGLKEEPKEQLLKNESGKFIKGKTTVESAKTQTNKNIEVKGLENQSPSGTIERKDNINPIKRKSINPVTSDNNSPSQMQPVKSKETSQDFRLIKMQSGESIYNQDNSGNNLQFFKKPTPITSAIKPGVNVPTDNSSRLDTKEPEVGLQRLEKRFSLKGTQKDNPPCAVEELGKQVVNGADTKKTTANERHGPVQVSPLNEIEKLGKSSSQKKTLEVGSNPGVNKLHHDQGQPGFATIREQTEPEASGYHQRSNHHTLDLPSKAAKTDVLGEESIQLQLSLNPQTDPNLQLLRQNLRERNELIAKPNFSCSLIGKDVLQIIAMEEEKQRREEAGKEIVMLEAKKYEELFEMVRTETFTHSQTAPSRVAGGWMEYEATGASTKAQDM